MANRFFTSIKARFFNSPAITAVDIGVDGDVNPRIAIDAGGRISWGGGSSAADTNLYRLTSNHLKTSGTFSAAKLVTSGLTEIFASSTSLTTLSPSQTIDISDGKSIKYLIHAENDSDYEVTEILAIKRGSSLHYVEYGKISTSGSDLAQYDVVLDNGSFSLKTTPSSADMSFTILKTIIA